MQYCPTEGHSLVYPRTCSQLAALLFLLLDIVDTLGDEYLYIWKGPNTMAKCLFLASRYIALLFLLAYFFTVDMFLGCPTNYSECVGSTLLETTLLGLLAILLEILLIFRLYVLYDRSAKMGIFLCLMLLTTFVSCTAARHYMPQYLSPNGTCVFLNAHNITVFLGVFCLVNLTALSFLVYVKCRKRCDHPVYRIMSRDSACVLCVLFLCGSIGLPGAMIMNKYTHLLPGPIATGLSVTTCRLILNTRALPSRGDSEVLSTAIDVYVE